MTMAEVEEARNKMSENLYATQVFQLNENEDVRTEGSESIEPRVFVSCNKNISEYILKDKMTVGRPSPENVPDIPIDDPHVSRQHGTFETNDLGTIYIPDETTNGIRRDGVELWPGGHTFLQDGDELVIPATGSDNGTDIIIVYVDSPERLNIWRSLSKGMANEEV